MNENFDLTKWFDDMDGMFGKLFSSNKQYRGVGRLPEPKREKRLEELNDEVVLALYADDFHEAMRLVKSELDFITEINDRCFKYVEVKRKYLLN